MSNLLAENTDMAFKALIVCFGIGGIFPVILGGVVLKYCSGGWIVGGLIGVIFLVGGTVIFFYLGSEHSNEYIPFDEFVLQSIGAGLGVGGFFSLKWGIPILMEWEQQRWG